MKISDLVLEEIEAKCLAFENMTGEHLFRVIPSLVYNSFSSWYELTSVKRMAYAYALSRSWIEYGAFDFDLIPKFVVEFLENVKEGKED